MRLIERNENGNANLSNMRLPHDSSVILPSFLRGILLIFVTIIVMIGCDGNDECSTCDNDMDCEEGLDCRIFNDGVRRCVDPNDSFALC